MSHLCEMNPGMVAAGIVEGSVAHVIASTWKYGNCYTNSIEIAKALSLDPDAPSRPAPSAYRFTVSVEHRHLSAYWYVVLRNAELENMSIGSAIWQFDSEEEARKGAALVLAALHQAVLE